MMREFLRRVKTIALLALRRDFAPDRVVVHDERIVSDGTDVWLSNGKTKIACGNIGVKPTQITFRGQLTISHHFFSSIGGLPAGSGPTLEVDDHALRLDTSAESSGRGRAQYDFSVSLGAIDIARLNIGRGSRVCLFAAFNGQNACVKGTESQSICMIDYEYEFTSRDKVLAKKAFTLFTALTVLAFVLIVPGRIDLMGQYLTDAYVYCMNQIY